MGRDRRGEELGCMCDELCPILSQLQTSSGEEEEEDSESQARPTPLTGGGCQSSRQFKQHEAAQETSFTLQ